MELLGHRYAKDSRKPASSVLAIYILTVVNLLEYKEQFCCVRKAMMSSSLNLVPSTGESIDTIG